MTASRPPAGSTALFFRWTGCLPIRVDTVPRSLLERPTIQPLPDGYYGDLPGYAALVSAVETALRVWQRGSVPDLSAAELQTLFNSEFWILSSGTRSSGAGFVLKRTLSRAKRDLERANNPT